MRSKKGAKVKADLLLTSIRREAVELLTCRSAMSRNYMRSLALS